MEVRSRSSPSFISIGNHWGRNTPFCRADLGEAIIGMAVGETKTVRQTLPQTWLDASMRGEDVLYEITVLEVLAWELPEVSPP